MPFVGLGNREFDSISVHQKPFVRGLPEYGITNSLWIRTLSCSFKLYIYRCFFSKYIACGTDLTSKAAKNPFEKSHAMCN